MSASTNWVWCITADYKQNHVRVVLGGADPWILTCFPFMSAIAVALWHYVFGLSIRPSVCPILVYVDLRNTLRDFFFNLSQSFTQGWSNYIFRSHVIGQGYCDITSVPCFWTFLAIKQHLLEIEGELWRYVTFLCRYWIGHTNLDASLKMC